MINPREIRYRIAGIKNTRKITRAMKMVAAAKLRRVLDSTICLRHYAHSIRAMKDHIMTQLPELAQKSFEGSIPETKVGVLFFTGDKGLCGSFNINLIKEFDRFTSTMPDAEFHVFAFGCKGKAHIQKRHNMEGDSVVLWDSLDGLINRVTFPLALGITKKALRAFRRHKIDSFYIVCSTYINALSQKPYVHKLWPPDMTKEDKEDKHHIHTYLYEPDPEILLQPILERFVSVSVYRAMLESASSEYAARMTAMESATKNSEELIDSLTLEYNKARQSAITSQLLDILGAMKT